jgi:hypothetical protein
MVWVPESIQHRPAHFCHIRPRGGDATSSLVWRGFIQSVAMLLSSSNINPPLLYIGLAWVKPSQLNFLTA